MANLIFQTAFIGDALLTVPLIKQIQKYYPNEKPSIVCRPALGSLFEGLGLVEKSYGIDKSNPKNWVDLKLELTQRNWNTIFCPHQSFRSALFLRSIKADKKISYQKWWNSTFFNARVKYPSKFPEALRVLSLLAEANEEFSKVYDPIRKDPQYFSPTEQDTILQWSQRIPPWAEMHVPQAAESVTATHDKYNVVTNSIFIAPGSVWATKRWTLKGFTSLTHKLIQSGNKVYFSGDKTDSLIAEEIVKAVPQSENLCGKTNLLELHALFSKAKLIVSNDSSPIHMAALAGAPVIALFGPTTLGLGYRPWTNKSHVIQKNLACRPCGKHGHDKCPIKTHACMHDISAQEVFSIIQRSPL